MMGLVSKKFRSHERDEPHCPDVLSVDYFTTSPGGMPVPRNKDTRLPRALREVSAPEP
nr:MAG TPA: hypothetical protein [Caudoviricetes sp.]